MIALVDTNVVLDVMLSREPYLVDSAAVLAAVETSRCQGLLCATTLTTIYYITRRVIGHRASLIRIAELTSIFGLAPVNQLGIASALLRGMDDFEDAVLHEAALHAGAGCIVTRNVKDFVKATLPVYSPTQFLSLIT